MALMALSIFVIGEEVSLLSSTINIIGGYIQHKKSKYDIDTYAFCMFYLNAKRSPNKQK